MKRLTLMLFAALAVIAVSGISAVTASAANTLPSLLWLAGTTLNTTGTLTAAKVAQFNSTFATITAGLVLVKLEASGTQMASLGVAKVLFEKSELNGSKCFSEGDSLTNGAVLIDNAEWHIVLDASGITYILILIPETLILCDNGINFKVRGSVLNKTTPFHTGEVTSFSSETLCEAAGSRKAKWKAYLNDTTTATAKLEANGGIGFEEVCEELKNTLTTTPSEMAEIMEP